MIGIIVAFGPSHAPRAVKAVRKLTNPWMTVVVVPAHPSVILPDIPGATVAGGTGSREIRSQLRSIDPAEPVLIIHDDAAITARGLRKMIDTLGPTSPVAIPFTNDTGTDHYIGTLPPPGQAEAILDQLSVPEPRVLQAFRPSVAVGYAAAMLDLAVDGYIDPFRMVHDPAMPATVAPAVASHAGNCTQELADPEDDRRPLLVASMIVKNEEDMLPDCLASLVGVVDRIEVCDTGSEDGTIAIAEASGARVGFFPWTGNFSEARNFALDRCRDARLVLHIDADERVETRDPVLLRRYLATYGDEYDGFQPKISNIDAELVTTSTFRATRIFPAAGTRFDGPIHEVPMRKGMATPIHGANLDLLALTHLGYADAVFASRDKGARNIEIARRAYEQTPGFRTAYDYARSLMVDDAESAFAAGLFEEALADIEVGNPQAQAYVYGVVAGNRLGDGDYESAMELARKGLDIVPREAGAAVSFARAALALDRPGDAIEMAEWRASAPSIAPLFDVTGVEAEFRWHTAVARARLGRLGDAYDSMVDSISLDPRGIAGWRELLPAFVAAGVDVVEVFAPMAELEGNGRIVKEAAEVLKPSVTAALGLAYIERGGEDRDALAVATMASLVADEADVARRLFAYGHLLDEGMLHELRARAQERGLEILTEATTV